jgi:hypothetical protein
MPLTETVTIYALCDDRISDPVARVRYIGQTIRTLDRRLKIHWQTARAGERTHRAAWMRTMAKASAVVTIEALAVASVDEADAAERAHIAAWRSSGSDLTNIAEGGAGVRGLQHSESSRRRMSVAARARKATAETRATMSAAMRGKFSTEYMRALSLGRSRSSETRQKMSSARRGEGNGMAKLSWESAEAIRKRHTEGEKQAALALAYNVSPALIHRVVHGAGWVRQ